MPEQLTLDAKEADSSPATEHTDDNATDTSTEESSTEETLTTKDIIQAELDKGEEGETEGDDEEKDLDQEESEATDEDEESEEDEESTEDTDNEDEEDEDEDDNDIPEEFHKHPAWIRRIKKQKEAEDQLAAKDAELEKQAPVIALVEAIGTERMDFYAKFLGLSDSNPRGALELINPLLQNLLQKSGHTLSDELKQQVEDGEMTMEQAQKQSQLEAENAHLKAASKEGAAESEEAKAQANGKALGDAANAWEVRMRKRDPDFKKLAPAISVCMFSSR